MVGLFDSTSRLACLAFLLLCGIATYQELSLPEPSGRLLWIGSAAIWCCTSWLNDFAGEIRAKRLSESLGQALQILNSLRTARNAGERMNCDHEDGLKPSGE